MFSSPLSSFVMKLKLFRNTAHLSPIRPFLCVSDYLNLALYLNSVLLKFKWDASQCHLKLNIGRTIHRCNYLYVWMLVQLVSCTCKCTTNQLKKICDVYKTFATGETCWSAVIMTHKDGISRNLSLIQNISYVDI